MATYTGATSGLAAGVQTNDTSLDFALETTYGTAPGGNYQALRFTSETLARQDSTSRPDEINAVREVSQSVLTQVSASGTISGPLATGCFDDFLAGVMGNDGKALTLTSGGAYFNFNPDGSITSMNFSSADYTSQPLYGGVIINSPSNGFKNVYCAYYKTEIGSSTIYTADLGPVGSVLKSKDGDTFTYANLVNGSIDKTFTVRKKLLSGFQMFTGSLVNQMQIQLQQGQFGSVSVDLTCGNMTRSTTDIAAAVLPAPTGVVHDSISGFLGLTINGVAPVGCVTQATITLSRDGAGNDYGMGHADACGVRSGSFMAAGSIEFYFRSWDQFDQLAAGTQGPIVIKSVDGAGDGYAFMFLNAALRNGKDPISGKNQTVKATFDIEGNPAAGGGTFAIFPLTGTAAN
ncbi:phage tail tube protein [Acetobacter sacchari]|nr:phage tail tube protein [Acetobacter sacchari]